MDWLQFTANIVASLAWPTVIVLLLIFLRDQIRSLATRLEELTLPGGAKAKFVKELEALRKTTEKIPIVTRFSRGNIRLQDGQFLSKEDLLMLDLAHRSPEALVLEGYREIEEAIERRASELPVGSQHRNPQQLIEELVTGGFLDSEARSLFFQLRETRNTAAHAGRINPGEAIEFREHAKFFAEILGKAINDLIDANQQRNAPALGGQRAVND